MLYLIGAISIISLILNILIYRRLSLWKTVDLVVEEYIESEVLPALETSPVMEPEPLPESEPEQLVTVDMVKEVYQGWVNRTNIPAFEGNYRPQSPVKKENPGPLQRPQGFI